MLSWNWASSYDLESLLREMTREKNRPDISEEQLDELYELKTEVEDKLVGILESEVLSNIAFLRHDPLALRDLKDELRANATEAPTARIRRAMHDCANKILKVLEDLSEKRAEEHLSTIEQKLLNAEDMLTSGRELSSAEIQTIDDCLYTICELLLELKTKTHLIKTGLPRVAEKQGEEVEFFINELEKRTNDVREAVNPLIADLPRIIDRERRKRIQKQEEDMQQRNEELTQAAHETKKVMLEREIQAIERRNELAGKAARNFLEHIRLGNAGGAKSCLEEIRKRDSGYPSILRDMYGELLRQK